MDWARGGLLIAVGAVAGFLNVLAGGGSLLTMPAMVFMGMSGPVANGTNRVAILAQNLTSTATFVRQGYAEWKLSLSLTLCALPGTVLGAILGTRLRGVWFDRVLAAVMIGVLILMSRRSPEVSEARPAPSRRRTLLAHGLMLVAGFYGGFIQAGVGFLMMAILHNVLGLDLVRVNMHKVFIVGSYTLVALAIFAFQGQVRWRPGLRLALGNAAGGYTATRVAIRKGDRFIRIVLTVALVVMAAKLLLG